MALNPDVLRKKALQYVLDEFQCDSPADQILTDLTDEKVYIDEKSNSQRYSVNVNLKKFLSDLDIRINSLDGTLISWCIEALDKDADETLLSKEEALRIASNVVDIPQDSEIEEIIQEKEPDSHITNLTWRHLVNNLEIENDSIYVQINSKTKKVISVVKVWNDVKEQIDFIKSSQAIEIAEKEAEKFTRGTEYNSEILDQKYIPQLIRDEKNKTTMNFIKVWQVLITEQLPEFPKKTILNINCLNGEIVKIEHQK